MLNNRLGICTNARNAWPDWDTLASWGKVWLRTIVYSFDELDLALQQTPPDVSVIALINSETEGVDYSLSGWAETTANFATRFANTSVKAVECLNEWDLVGYAPEVAVQCALTAQPELAGAGIKTLLGSVAGPEWYNALAIASSLIPLGTLDGACFHPYGKSTRNFPKGYNFGEISEGVTQAYNVVGLPIWITEYGVPVGDVGGEWGQAKYLIGSVRDLDTLPLQVLQVACYFCWRDDIGTPDQRGDKAFGLIHEDGSPRPALKSFQNLLRS